MNTKKVTFEGWKNCIEITNGDFRLIAATEIGPRIVGGFLGDNPNNIFYISSKTAGKKGDTKWHLIGGHRLWHSPEDPVRTKTIDNFPIKWKLTNRSLKLFQDADDLSGIGKCIEIIPEKNSSYRIVHTLINRNLWPIQLAAWGLSVMAPGGVGIFPMPQQGNRKSLLPNTFMAMWPYNNMGDGRISVGSQYTIVRNNPKIRTPSKIGYNCEDGWIAYQNHGITFVKQFDHFVDGDYPDNGCSVECYTCRSMQEMETLSPLYDLQPGEKIVHTEIWHALKLASAPVTCEKDAVDLFG